MSETAVRVRGLGKRYRIAHLQQRHDTLRDALAYGARNALRRVARGRNRQGREENTFWALRDVSFELARGEVLGVIGANGAGKSTLLKILSRITEPTVGEAEVRGRVGSLLEVGTGFNWELSGRENIYLNGAILGMKRTEITRKFDEIVAFSEVGPFIDTPVKHYSSGMYLRLAFAVAAHLEPEILIVDEVLAVGDAAFQKKCLGKMGNAAREGRTVLFVSHNMDAVQRLCTRCLYLEGGTLAEEGDVSSVITRYLARSCERVIPHTWIDLSSAARIGSGEARFTAVRFSSCNEAVGCYPYPLGPLEFDLIIRSDANRSVKSLSISVRTQSGTKLINVDTVAQGTILHLKRGDNLVKLRIAEFNLNAGTYAVGLWLAATSSGQSVIDYVESAFDLEVVPSSSQGLGVTPGSNGLVASRFEVIQEMPEPAIAARHADASCQSDVFHR